MASLSDPCRSPKSVGGKHQLTNFGKKCRHCEATADDSPAAEVPVPSDNEFAIREPRTMEESVFFDACESLDLMLAQGARQMDLIVAWRSAFAALKASGR